MADFLFQLYLTNSVLLINHEIDSAYWKEWELFRLPGGIAGFLLIHFPLLFLILYGLILVPRHSFFRSKGAYAGISLDGSVVKVNGDWNRAYYGKDVRPVDILVKKDVSNPKSAKLREALFKAAQATKQTGGFCWSAIRSAGVIQQEYVVICGLQIGTVFI